MRAVGIRAGGRSWRSHPAVMRFPRHHLGAASLCLLTIFLQPAVVFATPQLALSLNASVFSPGAAVALTLNSQPGSPPEDNTGDLYVAVQVPGGSIFASNGSGFVLVHDGTTFFVHALVPHESALTVTGVPRVLLSGLIPDGAPPGAYTFYAVLVRAGMSAASTENWLSNLAAQPFTITAGSSDDLDGTYIGSLAAATSECQPPEPDDSFTLAGSISIVGRQAQHFDARGTFAITRGGVVFRLVVNLTGTVGSGGQIDSSYTESFSGENGFSSSGYGTARGVATGNGLSLDFVGVDTDIFGVTCQVSATFSGSR